MKIKFDLSNVGKVAGEFQKLSKSVDTVAGKMVKAGCQVGINAMKESIAANGHVKSGAMMESVSMGKIHKANGGQYAYVYPQGVDSRGVENYLKARKAHFGTSKRTGSHFADQARDNAEAPALEAMLRVWESMKEG